MEKTYRKEVRWLLLEKYHWVEAEIQDFLENPWKFEISKPLKSNIGRVQKGEPIDYVIGFKYFLNCKIDLSLKPLIPRDETEYLARHIIKRVGEGKICNALDLCCGSGCLGISLLKNKCVPSVLFSDKEILALEQTKINIELNGIQGNRSIIKKSNLFCSLGKLRFDLIVCNPPYVDENGKYQESLKFEPREALFSPEKGFSHIRRVLGSFESHLTSGGYFFMEFGEGQEECIRKSLKGSSSFSFLKDQFGITRFLEYRKG